jgi:hypothetical protein
VGQPLRTPEKPGESLRCHTRWKPSAVSTLRARCSAERFVRETWEA